MQNNARLTIIFLMILLTFFILIFFPYFSVYIIIQIYSWMFIKKTLKQNEKLDQN